MIASRLFLINQKDFCAFGKILDGGIECIEPCNTGADHNNMVGSCDPLAFLNR